MIFKNCSVGGIMYIDKPDPKNVIKVDPSNSKANLHDSAGDEMNSYGEHYWEDE